MNLTKGLIAVLFLSAFVGFPRAQDGNKMRIGSDDIIAKHLASIATPAELAKVNSRVMLGRTIVTSKGGHVVKLTGQSQLASAGEKFLLAMIFDAVQYPYEKVGYDGDNLTFGKHSGPESSLAFFLRANKTVMKRGVFGGALNANWPLFAPNAKNYVDYDGISKTESGNLHKLKYTAPGIGSLTVTMYFEDASFRHVRTEYKFMASGLMSYSPTGLANSGTDSPDFYTLIESFGNFAKAGDLTLPLLYTVEFSYKSSVRSYTWETRFTEAYYNETLDAGAFKVS